MVVSLHTRYQLVSSWFGTHLLSMSCPLLGSTAKTIHLGTCSGAAAFSDFPATTVFLTRAGKLM